MRPQFVRHIVGDDDEGENVENEENEYEDDVDNLSECDWMSSKSSSSYDLSEKSCHENKDEETTDSLPKRSFNESCESIWTEFGDLIYKKKIEDGASSQVAEADPESCEAASTLGSGSNEDPQLEQCGNDSSFHSQALIDEQGATEEAPVEAHTVEAIPVKEEPEESSTGEPRLLLCKLEVPQEDSIPRDDSTEEQQFGDMTDEKVASVEPVPVKASPFKVKEEESSISELNSPLSIKVEVVDSTYDEEALIDRNAFPMEPALVVPVQVKEEQPIKATKTKHSLSFERLLSLRSAKRKLEDSKVKGNSNPKHGDKAPSNDQTKPTEAAAVVKIEEWSSDEEVSDEEPSSDGEESWAALIAGDEPPNSGRRRSLRSFKRKFESSSSNLTLSRRPYASKLARREMKPLDITKYFCDVSASLVRSHIDAHAFDEIRALLDNKLSTLDH